MRDECEHGHLRRSCDMCNVIADHVREITEKNAEIAELRYSLSQAHSVAQACAARAERAETNAANWEEQANDRVSDWDEVRAERDALKLRLAAVEDMNAACNADFSRLRAERDALRARLDIRYDTAEGQPTGYGEDEIDRLRKAIKLAPHSAGCAFIYCHAAMPLGGICATGPEFHSTPPQRGGLSHPFVPGECKCWMRAALKGEK